MNTKFVDTKAYFTKFMESWSPNPTYFKDDKDAEFHKLEATKMLEMFSNRLNEKIEMVVLEKKAKDKNHAWNLIKPKLKEYKIFDKDLNVVGVIDNIEISYDELVYVIDYKTSKLYRHTLPEEYVRQVSIYAYLYLKEFGKLPNFVGINYLRYGEVFIIPVTKELVEQAIKDIHMVREKSVSKNLADYPRCSSEWCDCNHFEKIETVKQ
jgi:CRISPR/Cas system-associated exonuclease Cas4 (RecB family)